MEISRRVFFWAAGAAISGPLFAGSASKEALAGTSPKYLVPFIDPQFGSKVVKVTNPNSPVPELGLTWGKVAIHHYSTDQAWNADQTLLVLDRGTSPKVFLDGRTYKPLMAWKDLGDIRWHPVHADLMVFLSSKGVGLWNIRKNTTQILDPLSDYTGVNFGMHKGNLSSDGKMLAVLAKRSDGATVAFAYNLETGKKHRDIDMSKETEVGWTTISPTGGYIVSYTKRSTDQYKLRRIFTADGELLQTWPEYERPGHGDFMIDGNGDEIAVGRSKSEPDQYMMIKRRLADGRATILLPKCYASHTSARCVRYPGWVFATFTPDTGKSNYADYSGEVAAVAIDGSQQVRSLAQTNAVPNGYLTEPHGCPSPDGKKAIFASNWGIKDGSIAAYVAEYPD